MEHQTDNTQHIKRGNNDSFEIFKPKILMAIDKIKGTKERERERERERYTWCF